MKYTDITSFEKACEVLNRPATLPDVSALSPELGKHLTDYVKLTTIIEAMNFVEGEWKPDFTNWDQPKYYAWPEVKADAERKGGFGFSGSTYDCDLAHASVCSRLLMKLSDMVYWALKQHEDLFISVLLK